MTLQQCYDNNDKQGFLVLSWNLCCFRKITHHEYCELKDVHDNWDHWKSTKPNVRIMFGNCGFEDGRPIFKE